MMPTRHLPAAVLPRIVSGIQPTGIPHIGNYFGSLKQWLDIQNESTLRKQRTNERCAFKGQNQKLFFVADLHALTVPVSAKLLRRRRLEMLAMLLAIGIDPKKSILFIQSDVPQHCEFMWLLACNTSMGSLNRMTQWKSKTQFRETDFASFLNLDEATSGRLKLGLFAYPVLQAADIILYRGTHVPIGKDQVQHLELTRTIANSINNILKKPVLNPPQPILNYYSSIMALRRPTKKMSKSDDNTENYILLTDTASIIARKISRALTDSISGITYDRINRPGISNLLAILSATTGKDITSLSSSFADASHVELKATVAEAVTQCLGPISERFQRYLGDIDYLNTVAKEGAEQATFIANSELLKLKKMLGLCF
ncbi:tryptophan-tRNA ligase Msw1 [Schizosaccharomyces japonicus yFS275]|uniref:tryptophan--tRNA ligase n=1 Tax=Schizosaccharomyces japonicus (strain yFS275 / FY16936) TaxID=402676 RepID=B6K7W6_SCHJY|nr:tryptophan-tRNA ligase Msw1 [Schizosaccharomyces japonicus yFS275]EEB09620.2 tryptophan-tRNA ligase Msw1 [Schizosaccharomyces japonicus yFS275]